MVVYSQQPEVAQEGLAKDLLPALLALPKMTKRQAKGREKLGLHPQDIHTSDANLHLLLCCRLRPPP